MPKNIAYRTDDIARYYSGHRRRWSEFYPSEQWVFEKIVGERGGLGRLLDVGCAAGGLAEALAERFPGGEQFTGVEINEQAAEAARQVTVKLPMPGDIITADICACPQLEGRRFDLVTSLSVADWNADAQGIIAACWDHVAPGGHLVISLRLTPRASVTDAYQYIWFSDAPVPAETERAPYVVFNTGEAFQLLNAQSPGPDRILAYGYWGAPSVTARLPYDKLVFAVFALRKPAASLAAAAPLQEIHLPPDAF